MSPLTFKLKSIPKYRLDLSSLTPDCLEGQDLKSIANIMMFQGSQPCSLGEFFEISGDDVNHLVFEQSHSNLCYIGSNMSKGQITVKGNAGDYLGIKMAGGTIEVFGDVKDHMACGMKSGFIKIHGDCGDYLGHPPLGERRGMQGGTILVKGNVGNRAGEHMRRGVILIEGDTGSYLGHRMIAGTIGVLGKTGPYPGYGMKHGSILLAQKPVLQSTFMDCGIHTLPFLKLLQKSWEPLPTLFKGIQLERVHRFMGDIGSQGLGEILVIAEID
jgi:formylmethanofuran dehydrogenase subunit C